MLDHEYTNIVWNDQDNVIAISNSNDLIHKPNISGKFCNIYLVHTIFYIGPIVINNCDDTLISSTITNKTLYATTYLSTAEETSNLWLVQHTFTKRGSYATQFPGPTFCFPSLHNLCTLPCAWVLLMKAFQTPSTYKAWHCHSQVQFGTMIMKKKKKIYYWTNKQSFKCTENFCLCNFLNNCIFLYSWNDLFQISLGSYIIEDDPLCRKPSPRPCIMVLTPLKISKLKTSINTIFGSYKPLQCITEWLLLFFFFFCLHSHKNFFLI